MPPFQSFAEHAPGFTQLQIHNGWVFCMAYSLEANFSFDFHNSLVNTLLQVYNNASLEIKNAKILKRELNERASTYTHF